MILRASLILILCVGVSGPVLSAVHEVREGGSIKEAIKKAAAGDTITVFPGIYREAIVIDKENIRLEGVIEGGKWPVLDGSGEMNDGVIASGNGFHIENLKIQNYKANGLMTQGANDVVIRHVIVEDTGLYGIYPTLGDNIVIEDTVTSGIEDAGIYVGQCTHVDVRRNELFHNVAGIEAENSENVLIEANYVHDNAGGILIFALPGLPKKTSKNTVIRKNFIVNNNHKNFAEVGSIVSTTPPGSGIVLLAADQVTIVDNVISGNSTAAITFADHEFLPGTTVDPEIDPIPDDNRILENLFVKNGEKSFSDYMTWFHFIVLTIRGAGIPDGAADQVFPDGGDLYVWGKGRNNCVQGLGSRTANQEGYFKECTDDVAKPTMVSMAAMHSKEMRANMSSAGEKIYAAVCSGCHGETDRMIGPSMDEVRSKYAGNIDGIADFAMNPTKVRDGYPPMPSQAHLGKETLLEVANYIFRDKDTKSE